MSPLIDINLDDTPDVMPTLKVGMRTLTIKDVKQDTDKNDKSFVNVEFEVEEPGSEEHGDKVWDRFYLEFKPAKVKFKQLCLSAGHGHGSGGVDTSELIGETVQALVKPRTYKDDAGEIQETTQISKYVYDAPED